jgi:predicted glycoside hydrolase/deacetylase ChbG (UPF0249 family)
MNLIINADDFGLTHELNQCVQYLYSKGILLSATIIANSPYFNEAVNMAKSSPGLGVGVHLCLDGPFNMNNKPNSLVNPENGQFYDKLTVIKKLRKFELNPDDIYKEYELQVRKILDNGIKIDHIDHHHHFHLYYQSLRQIINISKKYGIKTIRSQKMLYPGHSSGFNSGYRRIHQSFVKRHFKVPDGYFVLLPSPDDPFLSNLNRVKQLLAGKYTFVEIECHPNTNNDFDTLFLDSPASIETFKNHHITNFTHL